MNVSTLETGSIKLDSAAVTRWLEAFEGALSSRDRKSIAGLLIEDSYWRDLVAFTWNLRQGHGREQILDILGDVLEEIQPSNIKVASDRPTPAYLDANSPELIVEVFFEFDTKAGHGRGRATLEQDQLSGDLRLQTLVTQLISLHELDPVWPKTERFDVTHPGVRWNEHITEQRAYRDRDPQVLIVGGGHNGVMTAAHLARLGIDALIIDEKPRVGDAWRSRYESLILHQPHGALYFPFMKFPENYPEYIPKDKFAEWFEMYVAALDLNFWTSTKFISGDFDSETGRWSAEIELADGTTRTMHPAHLVIATGGNKVARTPVYAGLDQFGGKKMYASEFSSGRDYADADVLIIGMGTTAHDFAQDITHHGGRATIMQRGPQYVIDLETANLIYGDYNARQVPTHVIDDRMMAGSIFPLMRKSNSEFNKVRNELDKDLLDGLRDAGMRIQPGNGDEGVFPNFYRTYGGYYINVGASELIAEEKIKLLNAEEVDHFDTDGLVLIDGSQRHFDTIVYAIGYEPPIRGIESMLGAEVAEKLQTVWGFAPDGEINNVWKPTAQDGLWIMLGGIPHGRWYAPLVSLLIQAELANRVPDSFKQSAHLSRTPALSPRGQ